MIIDDTTLPKKKGHWVGVAPQPASSHGMIGNCQSLISVVLASREVSAMMGLLRRLNVYPTDIVLIFPIEKA